MAEKNDPIPSNAENRDQNPPHNSPVAADQNDSASDQNAGASVSTSSDDRLIANAQVFSSFDLLIAMLTDIYSQESISGEDHFSRVYEGKLQTGQNIAVKKLKASNLHRNGEFLSEIIKLSLLRHPNLVNLIGFSVELQRHFLVYELMPLGSLDNHLFDLNPESEPLEWATRMKIALGTARGLKYLNDEAIPRVLFKDLKTADIFLDEGFLPRISYYGRLAEFSPNPDVVKSEFYNFGVVLLELIAGRRHEDIIQESGNNDLFNWLLSVFSPVEDRREKLCNVVDRRLMRGQYSEESLLEAARVALLCLQGVPHFIPITSRDVVRRMERVVSLATHQIITIGTIPVEIGSEPPRNESREDRQLAVEDARKGKGKGKQTDNDE